MVGGGLFKMKNVLLRIKAIIVILFASKPSIVTPTPRPKSKFRTILNVIIKIQDNEGNRKNLLINW